MWFLQIMEQHSLLHGGQRESAGEESAIHGFVSTVNCQKIFTSGLLACFTVAGLVSDPYEIARPAEKPTDSAAQQRVLSSRFLSSLSPLTIPPRPLCTGA